MNRQLAFDGRRVIVVGLGASGFSAARTLLGLDARVFVTEASDGEGVRELAARLEALGATVEIGGHDLDRLTGDLAVVSPGIPPSAPVMQALRGTGMEVLSEVELAYRLAKCEFLAVTGTNGKTTTTTLLAAMLTEAGVPSVAAGNIGLPLIDAIFMVPEDGVIALEVSSFQLASIHSFSPRVAVLLNIAEDHTDWHGTVEEYAAAKARIIENQKPDDVVIVNAEDQRVMSIAVGARSRVVPFSARKPLAEGLGVSETCLQWRGVDLMDREEVPLPGDAGLEDVLAAAGAALEYGIDPAPVVRSIRAFQPLAHRLRLVTSIDGVDYIDDSKATNPHATLHAVRGLKEVVLIAGGRSKGIDLSGLRDTVPPVRAVVALGEAADELVDVFDGIVPVARVATMRAAVRAARDYAIREGSVLLSPGCASLDMYDGYGARGDDFAAEVQALNNEREVDEHGDR